jgi:hypothetical protein
MGVTDNAARGPEPSRCVRTRTQRICQFSNLTKKCRCGSFQIWLVKIWLVCWKGQDFQEVYYFGEHLKSLNLASMLASLVEMLLVHLN